MATLYKNRDIWYNSASHQGQRLTRSLKTKKKSITQKLRPQIELELLQELTGVSERKLDLPFEEVVKRYLLHVHNWSDRTLELNTYILKAHLSRKALSPTKYLKNKYVTFLWVEG